MSINHCYTAWDFREQAKRKVPKFVFDFVDGGAGNEACMRDNIRAYRYSKLLPQIRHSSKPFTLQSEVLGLGYAAPFGVAPLGLCGIIRRDAEIILSRVAAKYNVPFITSAASNTSVEDIAKAAGVAPWFQLYIPKDDLYVDYLVKKAIDNNCPVLVVTIDAAVSGRRIRDLKNGLTLPYKVTPSNILGAMAHPSWLSGQLLSGKLKFPNFGSLLGGNKNLSFNEIMSLQTGGELDWNLIKKIRGQWNRKLILKGVLSTADAILAKELGIDSIVLSNHGGRQLDKAPAPLSIIPSFRNAGLKKNFLMIDSGIRSGEDIIASLSQGAGFSFLGRGFLYALMAGSELGVDRFFKILINELTVGMKLLGCDSPAELSTRHICDLAP